MGALWVHRVSSNGGTMGAQSEKYRGTTLDIHNTRTTHCINAKETD